MTSMLLHQEYCLARRSTGPTSSLLPRGMTLVLVCRVFFQCIHAFESPTKYNDNAYQISRGCGNNAAILLSISRVRKGCFQSSQRSES